MLQTEPPFIKNHKQANCESIIHHNTKHAKYNFKQNFKTLNPRKSPEKTNNYCNNPRCSLQGKCTEKNVIYKATVKQTNGKTNTYIVNTSTELKSRLAVHQHSFKYSEKNQTSLSQFIHDLKKQKLEHELTWEMIDKGKPFSPVTNKCDLCTKEKFHILFQSNPEQLNQRIKIFSHCMHKRSSLIVPREKKKTPG